MMPAFFARVYFAAAADYRHADAAAAIFSPLMSRCRFFIMPLCHFRFIHALLDDAIATLFMPRHA